MKYLAEGNGTFFIVAVVIGSGIMAHNLSNDIDAIALLGNTLATGAILFVLIKMYAQISGAHFNPAVSLVFYIRKELEQKDFAIYVVVQIIGGLIGVFLTHYIFNIQIIQVSQNIRGEIPLFVSEIIKLSN